MHDRNFDIVMHYLTVCIAGLLLRLVKAKFQSKAVYYCLIQQVMAYIYLSSAVTKVVYYTSNLRYCNLQPFEPSSSVWFRPLVLQCRLPGSVWLALKGCSAYSRQNSHIVSSLIDLA